MRLTLLLIFLEWFVPQVFAGSLTAEMLAHYRFDTNGQDSLGQSPPFVLTNGNQSQTGFTYTAAFVIPTAPFTNGVLYVNGLYEPNAHFVHYLGTAPIEGLRYESFTVGLDFYPLARKHNRYNFTRLENALDAWTGGRYARWFGFDRGGRDTDNILTGGYLYRWIGFNRKGGLLTLTLNNQAFVHQFQGVTVQSGRWHTLLCSVDLPRRRIYTLFDGRPLETLTLPADFRLWVVGSPREAAEREFTFGNHSNGSVFFGYAAHLKLWKRALTEAELATVYSESLSEHPRFPAEPFPWGTILLLSALASLVSVFLVRRRRRLRRKLLST